MKCCRFGPVKKFGQCLLFPGVTTDFLLQPLLYGSIINYRIYYFNSITDSGMLHFITSPTSKKKKIRTQLCNFRSSYTLFVLYQFMNVIIRICIPSTSLKKKCFIYNTPFILYQGLSIKH